jgi:glycosyltransferase domain-containing protein
LTPPLLTVLLPSRNRPDNIAGQLKLLRRAPYPVIVADSSDAEAAALIRAAASEGAEYRAFAPELTLYDKLELLLRSVDTPFVLLVSDRKITLPHAIEPLLTHLTAHEDHIGALGYVLGFNVAPGAVDIYRVVSFTPTIGEDDPLQRHYHLMRRYQSRAFGVFRVAPLARAVAQARRVKGAVFQETLMMNALALQGKLARLPLIHTLQSEERSFHPPKRNNPFFWFLDDIRSFFAHYQIYRTALTEFIRELGIATPPDVDLDQLVDMIHAVWLHRNFDDGMLNHSARLLLGDALEPLGAPGVPFPGPRRRWRDTVRQRARRYIWRDEVLRGEPRHEIRVSGQEMEHVMEELDIYFGG